MENNKPNHGGIRPGAGRKPAGRKPRTIRLTEKAFEWLKEQGVKFATTPGGVIEIFANRR